MTALLPVAFVHWTATASSAFLRLAAANTRTSEPCASAGVRGAATSSAAATPALAASNLRRVIAIACTPIRQPTGSSKSQSGAIFHQISRRLAGRQEWRKMQGADLGEGSRLSEHAQDLLAASAGHGEQHPLDAGIAVRFQLLAIGGGAEHGNRQGLGIAPGGGRRLAQPFHRGLG